MGSYNYLGFAENEGPNVDTVQKTIHKHGIGVGTTRHEIGIKSKELIKNNIWNQSFGELFFRNNFYSQRIGNTFD